MYVQLINIKEMTGFSDNNSFLKLLKILVYIFLIVFNFIVFLLFSYINEIFDINLGEGKSGQY